MNASNQVLSTKRGEVRRMHVNRTYMVKSVTVMASPES